MKTRLEFLRNLRSKIPDDPEFDARYGEWSIEDQAEEMKVIEEYIEQATRAD